VYRPGIGRREVDNGSEQEKMDVLDGILNDVYQAVRAVTSPDRLAKVKQEQIEWFKKRNAAPSTDEKCKLMESRIKALQDLVW
jgi:uncharacterized protein